MKLAPRPAVNNHFYDDLEERWYAAQDDPVALLRAEAKLRNPWVLERIREALGAQPCSVLDIGCGAGFLSNPLAQAGHRVTGIDLSAESLAVARRHDATGSASYLEMDAHRLDFPEASFDVVSAMDFLEHTERPAAVVEQAARVLRPGGLFFFHTFHRNPLSWLVVIKGVEWFVRNVPEHMHVYSLFIKPSELQGWIERSGMQVRECHGVEPRFFSRAFWKMLLTGTVPADFEFSFTRLKLTGYSGMARKD